MAGHLSENIYSQSLGLSWRLSSEEVFCPWNITPDRLKNNYPFWLTSFPVSIYHLILKLNPKFSSDFMSFEKKKQLD